MTVTIRPNGQDQNAISLQLGYSAGASAAVDIQYATRPDFQFCIAPIFTTAAAAVLNLGGFNRAQTYFFRGREVDGSGGRAPWGPTIGITTESGNSVLPDYGVQIAPALICIPMRPSGLALAQGAAVDGYSIGNLLRPSPVAAWRAFPANGGYAIVVETDGSLYDTVALLETNLPEDAMLQIVAGPTLASVTTGAAAYSYRPPQARASANVGGRRGYHCLARIPDILPHRFIGIRLSGGQPPASLLHVTHLVIGASRTIKNYADMTDQGLDLSTLDRQRDGSPDAVYGFRGRKVDFDLALMTERQHEASFADLAGRVGLSEPVLIVPNSRAGAYLHDRILYGNLTVNRMTNSNARFTRSLSIESIINP